MRPSLRRETLLRMTRATIWLLCLVASVSFAACSSTDPSADEASPGSMYVAVIRHLDLPAPADDDERPIVYVADMNSDPLDLEDQIEVIGELDPDVDVRFVDDVDAAAETADGSWTARDHGWIVAVGTPVDDAEADIVTLRVEASEPGDEPVAWQLTLTVGDEASVVEFEELDAEFLVTPVSP